MPGFHRRRPHNGLDAWPGYVDALSTLLMVTIFVLLVFVLAQGLLSVTLTGKDKALERLNQEISQLTDMLSLERGRAADLQGNVASLAHDLGEVTTARDALAHQLSAAEATVAEDSGQVSALTTERDRLRAQLADSVVQAQSASARLNDIQGQLAQQTQAVAAANSQLESVQAALATTQQKLTGTDARAADLQTQLAAALTRAGAEAASLATARASLQQDQTQLAQEQQVVSAGDKSLSQQKQETDEANAEIALLNEQMTQLRAQLTAIASALQLQESQGRDKDAEIADLGRKLNLALAAKVQELQRYRSDFFGKLREILKDQPNIKVVGDRFVFQSDVLFPVDGATMTPAGQAQIGDIATAVKGIMKEIPPGLSWMLRVDGHADSQPITSGPYKDNWQLSAARAIAVVQLLIQDGVPADHLAATAFADTQPIDPAHTPEAYAKNRRIEFRLTDR
jgi:chemotaxis protein MotB